MHLHSKSDVSIAVFMLSYISLLILAYSFIQQN